MLSELNQLVSQPSTRLTLQRLGEAFAPGGTSCAGSRPRRPSATSSTTGSRTSPVRSRSRVRSATRCASRSCASRAPRRPRSASAATPASGPTARAAASGEFKPYEIPITNSHPYMPTGQENADCQPGQLGYALGELPVPGQRPSDPANRVSDIPGSRGPTTAFWGAEGSGSCSTAAFPRASPRHGKGSASEGHEPEPLAAELGAGAGARDRDRDRIGARLHQGPAVERPLRGSRRLLLAADDSVQLAGEDRRDQRRRGERRRGSERAGGGRDRQRAAGSPGDHGAGRAGPAVEGGRVHQGPPAPVHRRQLLRRHSSGQPERGRGLGRPLLRTRSDRPLRPARRGPDHLAERRPHRPADAARPVRKRADPLPGRRRVCASSSGPRRRPTSSPRRSRRLSWARIPATCAG